MPIQPGDDIAGFIIEHALGHGGMGSVYLAKHPRLPRKVALKLLSLTYTDDPTYHVRFEREANIASRFDHRNIVSVLDRGTYKGRLWIAMQYIEGMDASRALDLSGRIGLGLSRSAHIVAEVANGLDVAHQKRLLHRDVKPANILLAPGDYEDEPERVLLSDFGISRFADEGPNLTGTGNLVATLAYAAPERILAKPIDHRVDIYALGCVLYELLVGTPPFPAENSFAAMQAHLNTPVPLPSAMRPDTPAAFDDIVTTAMAKNPDDRYPSARHMGSQVRRAIAEIGLQTRIPHHSNRLTTEQQIIHITDQPRTTPFESKTPTDPSVNAPILESVLRTGPEPAEIYLQTTTVAGNESTHPQHHQISNKDDLTTLVTQEQTRVVPQATPRRRARNRVIALAVVTLLAIGITVGIKLFGSGADPDPSDSLPPLPHPEYSAQAQRFQGNYMLTYALQSGPEMNFQEAGRAYTDCSTYYCESDVCVPAVCLYFNANLYTDSELKWEANPQSFQYACLDREGNPTGLMILQTRTMEIRITEESANRILSLTGTATLQNETPCDAMDGTDPREYNLTVTAANP